MGPVDHAAIQTHDARIGSGLERVLHPEGLFDLRLGWRKHLIDDRDLGWMNRHLAGEAVAGRELAVDLQPFKVAELV